MTKIILILFTSLFFLIGCQRQEVIQTHGVSYLENREKLIHINKSNKNDIIIIMGQPATKGMTNENLWIYIERTRGKGKILKLGRSYLKKNNVLILEFNKYGILSKKVLYDKDDMNNIDFAKEITENDIKKENFIYSFLSSIRRKMQTGKK